MGGNEMSIASLVLGISSFVCNPFFFTLISLALRFPAYQFTFITILLSSIITLMSAIPAIVFSIITLRKDKSKPKKDGKAILGLLLGAASTLLVIAMTTFFILVVPWGLH